MNYSHLTKAVAPKPRAKATTWQKIVAVVIVVAYLVFIGMGIWLHFA